MLTDIFAHRYEDVEIWKSINEQTRRLIVQSFRLLSEQVSPYYIDGYPTDETKRFWKNLHDRIAMELGLKHLSPIAYSHTTSVAGKPFVSGGLWEMHTVCENWMLAACEPNARADVFVKQRLSLIEIGFRLREDELNTERRGLEARIDAARRRPLAGRGIRLPGDIGDGIRALLATNEAAFDDAVNELNIRFRSARAPLHYHNGLIQISEDVLTEQQIEGPFWKLLADSKWQNVDTDMKEAFDRRDTNGRDPAFYAARALESTIKIISAEKGWTHGRERGAHNFIDNLMASKNGFIEHWEGDALKAFFTKVRNPLGHGPGNEPMPNLSLPATTWAIEYSMSWIKSLINRT
ncbi:AbiJ-NTD4 domain-containing protein [Jiella marina]|uniref:AbiJ-NTD4 domain-containing protein n=1 Tax=Jiella sp. LLJ827 TaxID=2917712 RepID=UPI002100E28A|nr:hypothetical protein [Jiella sp. LLJ827]MCQ0986500.1 hypothetical protein [Jiella sp. LLJ827]